MEPQPVVPALSALAHEGRLGVFRLLVQAGPDGMAAGEIARAMDSLPNSMSANLAILSHAGLIEAQRAGRSILYRARYDRIGEVIAYLVEDCCGGRPEVCAPLRAMASRACAVEGHI
ncbi:MAG: transcriptional regulator, ArsR family [Caulobacteraceae bacterium]|nr:transcriptional regulator, ArsR family [Caulobacteraceae bacterium]